MVKQYVKPSLNWRERGFRKPGRKVSPRRAAAKALYNIDGAHNGHHRGMLADDEFLDQIDNCRSEEARRLLLGRSG